MESVSAEPAPIRKVRRVITTKYSSLAILAKCRGSQARFQITPSDLRNLIPDGPTNRSQFSNGQVFGFIDPMKLIKVTYDDLVLPYFHQ